MERELRAEAQVPMSRMSSLFLVLEGDRERDLLRAPIRLRLAALARQLPAAADGLWLVPAAARRLRSGAAEPPSGHARPRAQRARRQPFGGGARQPKRQNDGGRRAEG